MKVVSEILFAVSNGLLVPVVLALLLLLLIALFVAVGLYVKYKRHRRIAETFRPMFGLMGTLIPMWPALVGLATGDIAFMAYNMQVAFATTVVGMLIAGIGLLSLRIDRTFYAAALNDLEFFYCKLAEK